VKLKVDQTDFNKKVWKLIDQNLHINNGLLVAIAEYCLWTTTFLRFFLVLINIIELFIYLL